MIRLNEVAKKLEDILNGVDQEVIAKVPNADNPTGFYYKVATEGFHLDSVVDVPTGTNFVPVFISSMGGQINPVADLMQANYVIPIAIYFPIRYKDQMFKLNEYLARVFVGRQLNYGANSGVALSNISVAQFGEIVEMDLEQFKEWAVNVYKKPIEVMEPMLQMTIQLYLSTAGADFIYCNSIKMTLEYNNSEEEIVFDSSSLQSNSQTTSEQELETNDSLSLPFGTSYGVSFTAYPKNNSWWRTVLNKWLSGDSQEIVMNAKVTIAPDSDISHNMVFNYDCFIQSVNVPIRPGQLLTVTFSLGKKVVE